MTGQTGFSAGCLCRQLAIPQARDETPESRRKTWTGPEGAGPWVNPVGVGAIPMGILFPQSRACGTAATQGRPLRGHSCHLDFDGTLVTAVSLQAMFDSL
jgi:hypothetical protein